MNESSEDKTSHLEFTADIVSAYVSNNSVPADQLASLIQSVSNSLKSLEPVVEEAEPRPKPAVNPKRSVHDDYIICLEDGKKFKTLKRHLMTHYNMTPEQYREKWGLPADYPMVAAGYTAARSALAKAMGLGRKPSAPPPPPPTKRVRKPKAA